MIRMKEHTACNKIPITVTARKCKVIEIIWTAIKAITRKYVRT